MNISHWTTGSLFIELPQLLGAFSPEAHKFGARRLLCYAALLEVAAGVSTVSDCTESMLEGEERS